MEDKIKSIKIKLQYPDFSNVKPPTEHAVYAMIKNLHKAGKEKQ